jgi:hypothetical protein
MYGNYMTQPYLTSVARESSSNSLSTSCSTLSIVYRIYIYILGGKLIIKSVDTYPPIDPLSKPSFAYMTQGRRNTVWPDEFVKIETFVFLHLIFTRNLVIHHKHLLNDRLSNHLVTTGGHIET